MNSYFMNMNPDDLQSDQEVIEKLKDIGIQVIFKPVALVPDTLECTTLMGAKSYGLVEMNIHEALKRIRIRNSVMPDPFS